MRFFAVCPRGLETALAGELAELEATALHAAEGGVAFSGSERLLYRANLESRVASRILLHVGDAAYRTEDDIYRHALQQPWHERFECRRTIRVSVAAIHARLKSLDYVTLRIKDAICDAFRAATGSRPDVDTRFPDVRIHAFIDQARVSFYLDTSGEPLFKRGWRTAVIDAPLRENLAAGILRLTGWSPEMPLLDPMCGGGTLLLEAATLALGIAPGANRGFGFERLLLYDPRLWRDVRRVAEGKRSNAAHARLYAADREQKAIRASAQAFKRAGVEGIVHLRRCDILDMSAPAAQGILVANPPYGVRIGEREALAAFYPKLGDVFKQRFAGWKCFILSADMRLPKLIRLKTSRRTVLYNGALECRLYEFAMIAGSMRASRSVASEDNVW